MKIHWLSLIAVCGLISSAGLYASRDNAHFYRATNFFGEPRFEKPWLSTFDFYASYGKTSQGFNSEHDKVPLLDIYGIYNMQFLGAGVPGKDFENISDIILEELALLPSRGTFGQLSFDGNFSLTELNIFYMQNFAHGFFFQFHTPVRFMNLTNIQYCDLSPDDCQSPNQNDPTWQAFLAGFNSILKQHCLSDGNVKKSGIGDASLQIGWTLNYQETTVIDFLDLTIKSGYLFASSAKQNPNIIFDIPLGYNGHAAVPLSFDAALGTYDWLTIGGHIGALFFFNGTQDFRVKTNQYQSGFIKLAQDNCVKNEKGNIWEIGAYLKADHVVRGFSLLFGYGYVTEQKDNLCTQNGPIFYAPVVNSDDMFDSWNMHTLNLRAEYDFTKNDAWFGPRITFFYDYPISGKRIFRTAMVGGHCGIDLAWRLD
jgi:hypothetical protein